ncbi:hydroxyquinol 1,2-dioxygenase [Cupriavidus oxalaticus]|uniref:Hydroxyquinol 1,2-dioxygenase n=1 Tax=Cupriavidus oxalaticus TaxID=96344 RepID=A0A4P7LBF2_9BURK|nr:hydroxyquinol 1,2-dioxygenase [Cupriavidus oxalaticus]QBY53294.1 hydroxyquinol 1,2-dioxygenase [Cupriavidus oxalaticus]
MTTNIARRFVLAIALTAAAAGAQAASLSHVGARDPYTDGARSVLDARDPYSEGARSVQEPRSAYSDGARSFDPFTDGARMLAGLDRTGVSAAPARSADPYLDGAHA